MTVSLPAPPVLETTVAGLRIRALHQGAGAPLVLFHRSTGGTGWTPFLQDLAADHTVLAPDLPGFGASDRPEWARHPRDLAVLLGHWLAEAAGAPATVVGCGFGGWVAAELATMRPEVLRRLVLVGAAGLLPEQGRILDQVLLSHMAYVREAFHDPARFADRYGEVPSDEQLVTWDVNREMTARVAWKPYMYSRPLAGLLATVRTPTLVVWGDDDRVVPRACAEQYVRGLPDARLEIVADAGHAVDLEQPAALAALVRTFAGA
jgi:pimeloyl-ACP methyl ester carboxylesterase